MNFINFKIFSEFKKVATSIFWVALGMKESFLQSFFQKTFLRNQLIWPLKTLKVFVTSTFWGVTRKAFRQITRENDKKSILTVSLCLSLSLFPSPFLVKTVLCLTSLSKKTKMQSALQCLLNWFDNKSVGLLFKVFSIGFVFVCVMAVKKADFKLEFEIKLGSFLPLLQ